MKNAHKYFLKLNVLMEGNAGLLPECSVSNCSGDGSSSSTYGTLLLVCHGSYGPTINGRLLTDHTNYTHWVKVAGFRKAHA